ncbi:MAG: hypothetical protein LBL90_02820 [Prevotellaceae bacterium]|jgi:hypothetical protein|nr:hypothetical protein [Prevotellaceae bacterium]
MNRTVYNEFDSHFYCYRAVYEDNVLNTCIATNIVREGVDYMLPQGSYKDYLNYLNNEITKTEFEQKWRQALSVYEDEWRAVRSNIWQGQLIYAEINCFYPQAIILNIGFLFQGIANYDECDKCYRSDRMYPGKIMEMTVTGFDEFNMWVVCKPVV